jgi:hypothetical protein
MTSDIEKYQGMEFKLECSKCGNKSQKEIIRNMETTKVDFSKKKSRTCFYSRD